MPRTVRLFVVLTLLLGGCSLRAEPMPSAEPAQPAPAAPETPINPSASLWVTDGARRLSREIGEPRGMVITLDHDGHAHIAYQTALEWMGSRNEGKVIVLGTTPGGERYEHVLWRNGKGYATNAIAAWKERVVVAAGTLPGNAHTGLLARVWVSEDGGATWGEPQMPLDQAFRADVGFTPDGRIVLAAGVWDGGERFQTRIVVEQPGGGWQTVAPFPTVQKGNHQALWVRDPDNPRQRNLPALVVLASREGGFMIGRSEDGLQWETVSVNSRTAYLPRIVALDHVLLAVHTVYGERGIWFARSDDGGRQWQVAERFEDAEIWLHPGALLWDAQHQRVFLVLGWQDAKGDQYIIMSSAALDTMLLSDAAWSPGWRSRTWMPIPLPAEQTYQARPYGVQRGETAAVVWEGIFIPTDKPGSKWLDADFRPTSEPNYAIVRVAQLYNVWQALVAAGQ